MKINLNRLMVIIAVVIASNCVAQKDNPKKIIGCWRLVKMEHFDSKDIRNDLEKEALNSKICFTPHGKFTTEFPSKQIISGVYSFSDDGKTMYQSRDANDDGVDMDIEITSLNEKTLLMKTIFSKVYFERVPGD